MPLRTVPVLSLTGLAAALGSALAATGPVFAAPLPSAFLAVTSCDDSGPGSLREAVSLATSGDTIDASALTCGTISLTSGAIIALQDDLTISGPGRDSLAIDGGGDTPSADRVFDHRGAGWFLISGISIRNGSQVDSLPGEDPAGGCIQSNGNVHLIHASVTGCSVTETAGMSDALGGGVRTIGNLIVEYSVLSDNHVIATNRYARGGGAYARGSVRTDHSTISANSIQAPSYSGGGGLWVGGQLEDDSYIRSSTISGNAAHQGGGLLLRTNNGRSATVVNSTISDNVASYAVGGIYCKGALELHSSTVTLNRAGSTTSHAAGVAVVNHPFDLQGTIVAGNFQESDGTGSDVSLSDGALSGANNLVTATIPELPGDTLVGVPLLEPLADNGGPTLTHALHPDSPAIDAGNNTPSLSNDQRGPGFPREVDDGADIGAFEHSGAAPDLVFANDFDG